MTLDIAQVQVDCAREGGRGEGSGDPVEFKLNVM